MTKLKIQSIIMPNTNYTCPRCGYNTKHRNDMKRHLYEKKKLCPGQCNDINLTDDIKNIVMSNRLYVIPKPFGTSTVINNYNNVNNFIAGMDTIEKLQKYIKHKNIELIGFEQSIEDRYAKTVHRLENDAWKYGFELKKDDLFEVIDQVSKIHKLKTFEDLNIVYDKTADKLKIFDGEWEEMLLNRGVKKILQTIQSYYWDAYECFLLRKLYTDINCYNKQRLKEFLIEYYKFIGCFDVEPFVKNKDNMEIMGRPYNDDNEYSICDEYYNVYIGTRDNVKKSEINAVKKTVLDIIRKNSDKNITELNKRVFELFNIDEGFKNDVVPILVSGSNPIICGPKNIDL